MKPSTSSASFSSFERLFLKSLRPQESASLLLLCWVVVQKTKPLDEDWHYLARLAREAHHEQNLTLLIETARHRRLDDLGLAAEAVSAAGGFEYHAPFLRRAIGLAASAGSLDAPTYHLLGFLADLCHLPQSGLAQLYSEVTAQPLVPPADPSRRADDIPPRHTAGTDRKRQGRKDGREQYEDEGVEAETDVNGEDNEYASGEESPHSPHRRFGRIIYCRYLLRNVWQRHTGARWRLRQWRRIRLAREDREHQARQRAEREWAERQERARRERAQWQAHSHSQRHHQRRRRDGPAPEDGLSPWRKRLALQVLELDECATHVEIKKAYRRLAQRHHPDRHQGLGERRIALASQRFQRIKDAYEYLTQHA